MIPKNKYLFQAKSLDNPLCSQWLKKKSDEVALLATAKAVMFLIFEFDIDVFIFTYLDTVHLC